MRLAWSALALLFVLAVGQHPAAEQAIPGGRTWLHAHNCYPEAGRFADRLPRALSTGVPLAIEQDLVWAATANGSGQSVVSHGAPLDGREPTLDTHFFEPLRPLIERALAERETSRWPLIVLHLDFKTNEPEHHRAVWDLLVRHRAWLTTAERIDGSAVMPLRMGPLLVLTENGPGQESTFHDQLRPGDSLLLFGTVTPARAPDRLTPEQRLEWAASIASTALIPDGRTSYRRWVNFPWAVVERGGQGAAGEWTELDAERLRSIVGRARELELWTRFYTLNGHSPAENQGWSAGYNFGSLEAVRPRWQAAIAAGVEFVATDQYELFNQVLSSVNRP